MVLAGVTDAPAYIFASRLPGVHFDWKMPSEIVEDTLAAVISSLEQNLRHSQFTLRLVCPCLTCMKPSKLDQ
jgi:hypothetical protein